SYHLTDILSVAALIELFKGICWRSRQRKNFPQFHLELHKIEYQPFPLAEPKTPIPCCDAA
ncbi:MAG: hypothetical protein KH745_05385, partial [Bilophila sp.]|nr:hypothetical protein [Bilophila sp.]